MKKNIFYKFFKTLILFLPTVFMFLSSIRISNNVTLPTGQSLTTYQSLLSGITYNSHPLVNKEVYSYTFANSVIFDSLCDVENKLGLLSDSACDFLQNGMPTFSGLNGIEPDFAFFWINAQVTWIIWVELIFMSLDLILFLPRYVQKKFNEC